MFAKIAFFAIMATLTAQGTKVEGVIGTPVDDVGNGEVRFDTAGYSPDFNYIKYVGYNQGETVYTILFMGESDEPDDIIERVDFNEIEILKGGK